MTEKDETSGPPVPDADVAELEMLKSLNLNRVKALSRLGAQVDPSSVLGVRIDTLAEMVLGEDSAWLTEYKLNVQRKLAEALIALEVQVRQASMAAAAQASPEQVQQMARVNGLLGPDGRPLGG